MPWEIALQYASPMVLCIVLVWLIVRILDMMVKRDDRIDALVNAVTKAIETVNNAYTISQNMCARMDRLELAEVTLSKDIIDNIRAEIEKLVRVITDARRT